MSVPFFPRIETVLSFDDIQSIREMKVFIIRMICNDLSHIIYIAYKQGSGKKNIGSHSSKRPNYKRQ